MDNPPDKKEDFALKAFLVELAIYAVLVFTYFLLVLHFLTGWFLELFEQHRLEYAVAGLAVVIGQAVGLGYVTRTLLGYGRARKR